MESAKNNIIVSLLELQTNFEHHVKVNNQYNHYNELLTTTITNTINFINDTTTDKTIDETINETIDETTNKNQTYKYLNKISLDTLNINYDQLSKLNNK